MTNFVGSSTNTTPNNLALVEPCGRSYGREVLAPDATTALALANIPTMPDGARVRCYAIVQCSKIANVAVRWSNDGTDPTASVGMELAPGQAMIIQESLAAFKVIGVAVNSKVNVSYVPFGSESRYLN